MDNHETQETPPRFTKETPSPQLIPKLLGRLGPFAFTAHNMIGHPVSEVFYLLGLDRVGDYVHDITLPVGRDS
jgi:hypothetical protein